MEIQKLKQTVYLPVKVDEEFWKKWDTGEKPDYDLANIDTGENIESWVNEQKGYFFTPKQLNQLLSSVIQDSLNIAADIADFALTDNGQFPYVDQRVIKNQHSKIFEKMESLERLHLKAIENSYHSVYVNMNEVEEVNNELAASKSAQITKDITIGFDKWKRGFVKTTKDNYDIYLLPQDISNKWYTVEELFNLFLKTIQ